MKSKMSQHADVLRRLAGAALAVVLSAFFFLTLHPRSTHAEESLYSQRAAYAAGIRKTYDFRFGKEQPFLPSNAQIEGNDFIQPGAFPTAQYCQHCHQDSYHQWRQSAHANAFREPFYVKNVNLLIQQKGIAYTRHCEGCHNPIALFSGALTANSTVNRTFDNDGVTCMVCHSIAKLQPNLGTGSYVMGVPAVMVDEKGAPIAGEVSFDEILAHPDRHSKAVMKDFYKSPEYCGSCHKAALPKIENDYKWLRAFTTYDEWQNTSFSHQNPLTFYTKDYQSCQNCHMQRVPLTEADYGAKHGQMASHRWLGGNTAIAAYYHYDDQLKKTTAYLQANRLNIDLFGLRVNNSAALIAPVGSTSFTLAPKDQVEASVVIQNKMIGHSLIPEQRDFYQAWVEFTVRDASGRVIDDSGFLAPDGTLDPRAHSFTNRMVDGSGQYLNQHEVWARHSVGYDITIQSGRSSVVRYQFQLPTDVRGPLTVTARVNYRHFRQDYLNFVLGKDHAAYPVVQMMETMRTLQIGQNAPNAPAADKNPDWMRWNNYGIGLLDAFQYEAAAGAFEHVAQLRPDYADAYTNIAVTEISWEKFDSARAGLEKSLQLNPGNARALYYLSLVEQKQGHLDSAITDLRSVVQQFPNSRDARRELGHSYYQQHDYAMAREQFEALQVIDPDDLSAHYNLAIIYRRLGFKQRAAEQSALFAQKKDDPMALQFGVDYLRQHPVNAGESVVWHVHPQTLPPTP